MDANPDIENYPAVIRDPELREIAERISRNLEASAELESTFVPSAQLPLWPEPARGVPNDILRSALFAAIQGKGREYFKHKLLASYDGVQIRYTGEQLDQSDLDVWEQAIHLARLEPLGAACYFNAHAFLRAIKRSAGKSDYLWLQSVITRLQACVVEITRHRKIYGRSLVTRFDIDDVTRRFRVTIDPDMLLVYTAGWTGIDWDQRQKLRGKPLALWLHGYYASHASPVPVHVKTLRDLSGAKNVQLPGFRRQLRRAHKDLEDMGALEAWEIDPHTDLVMAKRGNAITASQKRYLAKRKRRKWARDTMHDGTGCGICPCIVSRVLSSIKSTTCVFSPAALIWFLISF